MRFKDLVGYDVFEDMDGLNAQAAALKRQQDQLKVRKKQVAAEKARQTARKKEWELAKLRVEKQ